MVASLTWWSYVFTIFFLCSRIIDVFDSTICRMEFWCSNIRSSVIEWICLRLCCNRIFLHHSFGMHTLVLNISILSQWIVYWSTVTPFWSMNEKEKKYIKKMLLIVPHHTLQSTTTPSSKYNTALLKVPHHPLQRNTPPCSKYHTTFFKKPRHHLQSTTPPS